MTPAPPDATLPARLREFHHRLPLAGDPPNALLALPDDRILYLAAILRDTPVPAPALSLDEWREFRDLLVPHGVFPLLAYRLRTWPEDCRPPVAVTDYLNRVFLYAAARSMRAGRQIQVVVDALEAAGIPSVLLKGPALARTLYPDPALRQSVDIDVLVQPGDVIAAEAALEGLGYVSPMKEFHVSQHTYHHQVFEPPGNGMPVELHWSLDFELNLFPAGWIEEALGRRNPIRANDLSGSTLSPIDHLLFLAFHNCFLDMAEQLIRVHDVALVMSELQTPEEWRDLVDRSVAHHIRIPLELVVTAAGLWAGTNPPNELADYSAWPAPTDRELQISKRAATRYGPIYSMFVLQVQNQTGIIEKVRCMRVIVLPPTPMLAPYRRSPSRVDIPLAHLRRWASIVRYICAAKKGGDTSHFGRLFAMRIDDGCSAPITKDFDIQK
jgi:hypothetical protein